jgi:hypothetical protein
MATEKDFALVRFLLASTKDGRIKWEPTAKENQYASSFKGKYTVTVDKGRDRDGDDLYWLSLIDSDGRELLSLYDAEVGGQISNLFYGAARASLDVDKAIDEIIGGSTEAAGGTEITDDDIPF